MDYEVAIFLGIVLVMAISVSVWWGWQQKRPVPPLPPVSLDPVSLQATPFSEVKMSRVGGVIVDSRDWTPDVLDKIRETYFRPSIKGKYVQVLDMTATCPRSHGTRDRVVLVGRDLATTKELSAGLLRSKAQIRCDECGRPGKITARAIVWEGLGADWDGSV